MCATQDASSIPTRPPGTPFSLPFGPSLTIRSYTAADASAPASLIASVLSPYGLAFDASPSGADIDAADPITHYPPPRAEFWVVADGADIVGTGAFRPWRGTVEIRKMYLDPSVRGTGLGGFVLTMLEARCLDLGYSTAALETASVLIEACRVYERRGYVVAEGDVETSRCDMVLEKKLERPVDEGEMAVAVDENGFFVAEMPRAKARALRVMYAAVVVVVLTKDGDEVFVQRRSRSKRWLANCLDPFVAGGVDAQKDERSTLECAKRETEEELGLRPDLFEWSQLWIGEPFVFDRGEGDRCSFTGFVARAKGGKEGLEVKFVDGEVSDGFFATRERVDKEAEQGALPSPVWKFVSGLSAPPPGLSDCTFFKPKS